MGSSATWWVKARPESAILVESTLTPFNKTMRFAEKDALKRIRVRVICFEFFWSLSCFRFVYTEPVRFARVVIKGSCSGPRTHALGKTEAYYSQLIRCTILHSLSSDNSCHTLWLAWTGLRTDYDCRVFTIPQRVLFDTKGDCRS